MGYNESAYLPIWTKYYAHRLGVESLYVIDHGSTDGSCSLLPRGVNVIRIPRQEAFDEGPRTNFVNKVAQSLLQYYDAVIYNDCDEIVVPHPGKYASFQDFFAQASAVTAPVGLHLFQALDREGKIDLGLPILGQRRFCQFSGAMCKPTLIKTQVDWSMGFHAVTSPEAPTYSSDIFLFHLKSIDRDQSLARLAETRAMAWSAGNIEHEISFHHRSEDAFHLNAFFDSPLQALKAETDTAFDFSADVDRVRSSVQNEGGFYSIGNFNGKVAQVPESFFGLF